MKVYKLYSVISLSNEQINEVHKRIKDGNFSLIPLYNMVCERRENATRKNRLNT